MSYSTPVYHLASAAHRIHISSACTLVCPSSEITFLLGPHPRRLHDLVFS